jgi:hypothetical protein
MTDCPKRTDHVRDVQNGPSENGTTTSATNSISCSAAPESKLVLIAHNKPGTDEAKAKANLVLHALPKALKLVVTFGYS